MEDLDLIARRNVRIPAICSYLRSQKERFIGRVYSGNIQKAQMAEKEGEDIRLSDRTLSFFLGENWVLKTNNFENKACYKNCQSYQIIEKICQSDSLSSVIEEFKKSKDVSLKNQTIVALLLNAVFDNSGRDNRCLYLLKMHSNER